MSIIDTSISCDGRCWWRVILRTLRARRTAWLYIH
jgi:hypothetical protein